MTQRQLASLGVHPGMRNNCTSGAIWIICRQIWNSECLFSLAALPASINLMKGFVSSVSFRNFWDLWLSSFLGHLLKCNALIQRKLIQQNGQLRNIYTDIYSLNKIIDFLLFHFKHAYNIFWPYPPYQYPLVSLLPAGSHPVPK